jgi:hypothetical protein
MMLCYARVIATGTPGLITSFGEMLGNFFLLRILVVQ